jgi:hypothetical protein
LQAIRPAFRDVGQVFRDIADTYRHLTPARHINSAKILRLTSFFEPPNGSFYAFVETDAKKAAIDCGSKLPHTQSHWRKLWKIEPGSK